MKYTTLVSILVAVVLSWIILHFATPKSETNFEEFALGEGTSAYFAAVDGFPIHVDSLNTVVVDSVIAGWELRGRKDVIFLLGNSQMHGVNQYIKGQKSYNHILFDAFYPNYDVLAHSAPNVNLQELLYSYQFWSSRVRISALVVPVFLDDMREDGIRFAYLPDIENILLEETNALATEWNSSVNNAQRESAMHNENAALANTVQERVELHMDSILSQHSRTWKSRPDMRGQIFTQLYFLRNEIFHINPQSVRRIIPAVYERNFHALELIAESTGAAKIPLLLYIPPIRSDVQIPYDQNEYAEFKSQVEGLTLRYPHIVFQNYETVVPGEYWGMKQSTTLGSQALEFDFMHFSSEGHRVLAASLGSTIQQLTQ